MLGQGSHEEAERGHYRNSLISDIVHLVRETTHSKYDMQSLHRLLQTILQPR